VQLRLVLKTSSQFELRASEMQMNSQGISPDSATGWHISPLVGFRPKQMIAEYEKRITTWFEKIEEHASDKHFREARKRWRKKIRKTQRKLEMEKEALRNGKDTQFRRQLIQELDAIFGGNVACLIAEFASSWEWQFFQERYGMVISDDGSQCGFSPAFGCCDCVPQIWVGSFDFCVGNSCVIDIQVITRISTESKGFPWTVGVCFKSDRGLKAFDFLGFGEMFGKGEHYSDPGWKMNILPVNNDWKNSCITINVTSTHVSVTRESSDMVSLKIPKMQVQQKWRPFLQVKARYTNYIVAKVLR